MNTYKLLTPGPLTTTDTVKEEMLVDRCTWDDDYKAVTQKIRRQLLQLAHVDEKEYTAVLMQGSGTFGVESVLSSVVGDEDKVLICSNGAYGVRMTRICDRNRIPYVHYAESYDHIPDPARVARLLAQDPAITHVAMVHSETTSGILNDIQSVGKVVRDAGRTFIVDAMSSFGGVDIPVSDWGIDFLVSSANKCIQGVPGFSFILCRRDKLLSSEGKARSLSLDLLDQWKNGDATADSFGELAKANSADETTKDNGGLNEDANRSSLDANLTDWLFAEGRQPGDAAVVEASDSSGNVIGYQILYVESLGEIQWKYQATTALRSDDYDKWYTEVEANSPAELTDLGKEIAASSSNQ